MRKVRIKTVESEEEKTKTANKLIRLYENAYSSEHYGEAELIVYAYAEDRLRALLFQLKAIKSWNSNILCDEVIKFLKTNNKNLLNASKKIETLEEILLKINDYPFIDINGLDLDINEIIVQINSLNVWCEYRNEVVHALFNKDLKALYVEFPKHIKDGFNICEALNKAVNKIKKGKNTNKQIRTC